jgi:tRNA dimethylallyltransferase
VLDGAMMVEQAKVEMRRLTRIFVRRQANWFKQSDPSIHWFEAGQAGVVSDIEQTIRAFLNKYPS